MELMVDLETWGRVPGCAIRSIGAVTFLRQETGIRQKFYMNVNEESQLAVGLLKDEDTVNWWRKYPDAESLLLRDQAPIYDSILGLVAFAKKYNVTHCWSHGPSFDEAILRTIADKFSIELPWSFQNVRCTRTIYEAAGIEHRGRSRKGVAHYAVDDAEHQAELVQRAYSRLKR